MNKLYLGIDTSNYKTSVAVVDENGSVLFNRSEYLDVKLGERGLRQSEAFFKHSNILPEFIADAFSSFNPRDIAAIGVSTRPRRVEGSYMPCFLAGYNLARELGSALNIPVYEYSHQEGHAAAILLSDDSLPSDVIFFHLSGGTTEFLTCKSDDQGYKMEIVGGTKDISIGQLLDRVGVELGSKFPAGKYLDDIALNNEPSRSLVPAFNYDNGYFNLSGIETKLIRWLNNNPDINEVNSMIAELFIKTSQMLYTAAKDISSRFNIDKVVLSGGVASSKTVRNAISQLDADHLIYFGPAELSGDNAVGIALLAKERNN